MKRIIYMLVAVGICINGSANDMARKAAQANNEFGLRLFKQVETSSNGNKFVSPTSAYLALNLLYNGTAEDSSEAMKNTLSLAPFDDLSDSNNSNFQLIQSLTHTRDFEVKIANAIWSQTGFPIDEVFSGNISSFYKATSKTVSFEDAATVDMINKWADTNTKGKIPKIVDSFPENLEVLLANATYFEALWTSQFDPQDTEDRDFKINIGRDTEETIQVPTMSQKAPFQFIQETDFDAIDLPYGEKREASLVIIHPKTGARSFLARSQPEDLDAILKQLDSAELIRATVSMPSIELELDIDLKPTMEKLGMGNLFDRDTANLSALSTEPTFVGSVKQKTYLKIFEKGTIAAAITSISAIATGVDPDPAFNINSSYIIIIRDKRTGAQLFIGQIETPEGGLIPENKT